jgi:predicted nucleotidyltransferase component of viral defense system
VTRPTRNTEAGRRYLDLQREAKRTGRPTDELIQLYALECFLDRLGHSAHAERFVLKGGVLLAALDARRPTRDIDFAALALENSAAKALDVVSEIAAVTLSDGLVFDTGSPTAETIRDDDQYSGLRITLSGTLSRAAIRLHVDINVGDPIWPAPQSVQLPRLLGGVLVVKGYPLEMILAEKLVTAITRGTTNTRWRDFLDVHTLIRRHSVAARTLRSSMQRVAQYREVPLSSLRAALAGFPEVAQARWAAWLRKQRLEAAAPADFSRLLDLVISFGDHIIDDANLRSSWNPTRETWE